MVLEEGLQLKVWVPHANAVSVELLASSEEVVRLPLSGEGEHWGGIVRGKLTTGSKCVGGGASNGVKRCARSKPTS